MGDEETVIDFDTKNLDFLKLYVYIKQDLHLLKKAQLLYKSDVGEYLTENISLDWLHLIDSHGFFVWLTMKQKQKQKYNSRNYDVVFRLVIEKHTSR